MASESTSNFTAQPSHAGPLTSCKDEDFLRVKSYLSIIYSLIFLVCFPGNIVTIFVYFAKMRPWKSSTIIMLNLAITDLLYVVTLPFFIHYYANGNNWIFGNFMCRFIHFCFYFNMYSGIIFLSCFSIFRFLVVVHPIKCLFLQKRRWAVVTCIVIWMISLVALSPLAILIFPRHKQNRTICPDLTDVEDLDTSRWYNWTLTVFAFFLPLLTVTLCYVLIIYTLATGPHTGACYRQKARRLAVILLVVFYVCFLPFHVFRGVRLELQVRPAPCHLKKAIFLVFIMTKPLAALNTFGNLLLYVVSGDNFQQAILSLLKFRTNKNLKQKRLMP
ncbi:2-oxoglutarate receptor 1 [Chiroxiphia lanceolata]|uniref:2-oxoglutarate receptor 1 n=1 Tax=Chiroxiphia lanceolata TaxID=296741 RepID=UPI0013CEEC3C|nr:2-oxoglutarate receptor 1 [Chiroxiphia lanceolata]